MTFGCRRVVLRTLGAGLVCLAGLAHASGQAAPEEKPRMAEEVFKNVQVLRGISVDEFMGTMGFFSASLGMNCTDCHTTESVGNWAKFADDTPVKNTARKMILMVRTINQGNFAGRRSVTCYSCHRGINRPEVTPSLTDQYGVPTEDPDRVEIVTQSPRVSADQILDRYIQALGGAQQLAKLTSFAGKGTYAGYNTDFIEVPLEVFAKATGQHTTIVHTPLGDSTTTYDGRAGWVAAFDKPLPLLLLTGGDLDGAKLDADMAFPARIKQALGNWRAGFQDTSIDDHAVQVIEGTTAGGTRVKFYFDKESGLLVRQLRYINTVIGFNPVHIDYADYREVAGVKMPFHSVVTWTDGQSTTELSDVQPNISIDPAKLSKPAPAPPPKPATP